jgi:hypothetical protein
LVETEVTDEQMANAKSVIQFQTPLTKKSIITEPFRRHFPSDAAALSVPVRTECSRKHKK